MGKYQYADGALGLSYRTGCSFASFREQHEQRKGRPSGKERHGRSTTHVHLVVSNSIESLVNKCPRQQLGKQLATCGAGGVLHQVALDYIRLHWVRAQSCTRSISALGIELRTHASHSGPSDSDR
jgi:hypothetical protein